MIEIGHVDINMEVSLLSSYSVMLRQGHLEAAPHIMGYLKPKLAFDPSYHNLDKSNFWGCDWTDFYKGSLEAIPSSVPL